MPCIPWWHIPRLTAFPSGIFRGAWQAGGVVEVGAEVVEVVVVEVVVVVVVVEVVEVVVVEVVVDEAQDPSGRVSSKEQTWQSAGLVWQSEHEVSMFSQLLKRIQRCLKTVVIHILNY